MPEQRFKPVLDDLDDGFRYIPGQGLVDAVNMTLVLRRPLLVKGPPGCGKTRLAKAIADQLDLPLHNWYVKSTSRAQDGLYSIDVVRRLQDAHLGKEKAQSLIPYLRFGALGHAIRSGQECVVLIDEIDKADIDFPNDLLRELDLMEFTIEELDPASLTEEEKALGHRREYKAAVPPVVIVTSNDEKELPDAFLRRCLFYYIDFPGPRPVGKNRSRQPRSRAGRRGVDLECRTPSAPLPLAQRTPQASRHQRADRLGAHSASLGHRGGSSAIRYAPGGSSVLAGALQISGRPPARGSRERHPRAVKPPLLEVFLELRRREFPLGIPEYEALLAAMQGGLASSRSELEFLCQTLWAKSRAEQAEVREVLSRWLPPLPDDRAIEQALIEVESEAASPLRKGARKAAEKAGEKLGRLVRTVRRKQPAANDEPSAANTLQSGGPLMLPKVDYSAGRAIDWVGSLPVTRRQMKRAWQYYRRMARAGPPVEIDLDRTLQRVEREGVLVQPVLRPRRVNHARLLILADEGGSMAPFRGVIAPLLNSAQTVGFARTGVYHFHDIPESTVFAKPWLSDPVALATACHLFRGAGILIVSDAGAARGNRDATRVARTVAALDCLRSFSPHVVWLNPMPQFRWTRSSASEIRQQGRVAMFPLDRQGLDRAVDVLRGRRLA